MLRIVSLIVAAGLVFAVARWFFLAEEPAPAVREAASAQASPSPESPAFPAYAPSARPPATGRVEVIDPYTTPLPPMASASPTAPPSPTAAPPSTEPPPVPPPGASAAVPGVISAQPTPADQPAGHEDADKDKDRGWVSMRGVYAYNVPGQQGAPAVRGQVNIATTVDCNNGAGVFYYRDPAQRVEWRSSPLSFETAVVCKDDPQAFQALANTFNAVLSGQYLPQRADAPGGSGSGQFGARIVSTDASGTPRASVEFCLALQAGPYADYTLPASASKPAPGCVLLDNFWVKRMKKPERQ